MPRGRPRTLTDAQRAEREAARRRSHSKGGVKVGNRWPLWYEHHRSLEVFPQYRKMLEVMLDGRWYDVIAIRTLSGVSQACASRYCKTLSDDGLICKVRDPRKGDRTPMEKIFNVPVMLYRVTNKGRLKVKTMDDELLQWEEKLLS